MRKYKYLDFITAFFSIILLVSNIASSKIVAIGSLTLDAGTILFPLSYIFGDILTEVYGYARSRRIIWIGFAMILLSSVVFMIVQALPASPAWHGQQAYEQILGLTPRIVFASLIAFFTGEFINSYIMARLKIRTKGRFLWLRTITSTLVAQGLDTGLFIMIAFFGVLENQLVISLIVSNYIFKVGVEVIFTPITYTIARTLKRRENEDYFDYKTNFNPFFIK